MTAFEFIVVIAGGIVTIAGAGAVIVKVFVKAVESVVGPQFDAIRKQQEKSSLRFENGQYEQDEEWYGELREVRRRITELADAVFWLESELKPNHGSSLRDAVDRLERMMAEHLAA